MYYFKFILFPGLFMFAICEIAQEKKDKLLSDYINYFNLQPNQPYKASEGYLRSIEQTDPNTYKVDISFKVEDNGPKLMQCTALIQDIGDKGIAIVNFDMHCGELQQQALEEPGVAKETSIEADLQDTGPVKLDNEVQADTGTTSGEQFIAIPRNQPTAPCIGCSSFINPQAEGVSDLANLGVRHLDVHNPDLKHSLDSVIAVERQVQVVNGVRYILTLSINFNNCTEVVVDDCAFIKTCKISILVKPWQILPSGSKYRAILSNNCTEEWQFGDNGEVLPELPSSDDRNSKPEDNIDNINADHEKINVENYISVNSQPNHEKTLSIDEIRAIEEQIIPNDHVEGYLNQNQNAYAQSDVYKNQVLKSESSPRYNDNFIAVTESTKYVTTNLSLDKKQAIDEMLDFLNFSGLKSTSAADETITREKRSYDYDLQVLSLTENYKAIKNSIENAKYIYEMAQKLVDYLNEIDMVIKNRAIKNVIKAEEEEEDNDKRFLYIQVQVIIPCDTANCEYKESETRVCNGVIITSNKNEPEILNSFCYKDPKNEESLDTAKEVPVNDPVLLRLTKKILMKMESESNKTDALKIKKVLSASTHLGSGRITKISIILERTNCNKSIPMVLRTNCSSIKYLGASVCEVIVHEREWHKDMKITYSCTERSTDMTISTLKKNSDLPAADDPKILEMLQESLQYLELKSNRQNKQTIITVRKISTNIIAGFLVNIEFIVGYTNCTNVNYKYSRCSLLKNEHLRKCTAHIWDRSWIVDGRQLDVFCDDDRDFKNEKEHTRKKRSLRFVRKRNQYENNHILGGQSIKDPNDPNIIKLANEAMHKYLLSKSNTQPHRIVRIEKATIQVVSGFVTRINFVITPESPTNGDALTCFSKIWEQSWLEKKDITVTCNSMKKRVKRYLVGGGKEQDPTNPIYFKLAEESMQKYLTDSGNSQPHKIVRINKVTTQVVAGSLTRIDFVVGPGENANGDELNCHSEVWERPWLDKKEITVTCNIVNRRDKRMAEGPMAGGQTEQNTNDPIYLKLAEESMQKYLTDSGNSQPHKIVRINKVTTQVVAGSLTRIDFVVGPGENANGDELNCHSEVWERPWLGKKEITVTCNIVNRRDKRMAEGPMAGGQTEQNTNDPIYLKLAEESMQKYLTDSGNSQPHKIVRINKVTTQVVAGSLTRIDFVVGPGENANGDELNCHSEVWERPWLDKKEITVTCNIVNRRGKRMAEGPMPGGQTAQNTNDLIYFKLAKESMQKYLTDSGNSQPHKIVRINKVTTQVVAGSLTRIDFVVAPAENTNGDELNCHSEVWERPWLDKKDITVSCKVLNQRAKREFNIAGGEIKQDPTDSIYLKLADESMQSFLTSSGNLQPHKIVQINKVTTEVVEGTLNRIDFVGTAIEIANDNALNCQSEVWEELLLNKKEIYVSCQIPGQNLKMHSTDDPRYLELAKESLNKYLAGTGFTQSYKVIRIDKVSTQIVSGILIKISFVVLPLDISDSDIINCYSEIWEKPWFNKKDIQVSCQLYTDRDKIQVPGIVLEENSSATKFISLAEESLQKYVSDNGIKQPVEVIRIEKATKKLAASLTTKIEFLARSKGTQNDIMHCISEILEFGWLRQKEINIVCEIEASQGSKRFFLPYVINNDQPPYNTKNIDQEQDIKKPVFQIMASQALQKFSKKVGIFHKVMEVKEVTSLNISGILYKIHFTASPTDCNFSVSVEREHNCNALQNTTVSCYSKIWDQPWINTKQISIRCEVPDEIEYHDFLDTEEMNKVSLKNGKILMRSSRRSQRLQDLKVDKLAEEALEHYLSYRSTKYIFRITAIHNSYEHVDDGILYKLEFSIAPTLCLSHEFAGSIHNCEFKMPKIDYRCNADIREQAWLRKKEIKVTCEKPHNNLELQTTGAHRFKRQLDIDHIDQDDNEANEDATYYYADRAVQHLNDATNTNNLYKLITVHAAKSSTQMKTMVVKMYIEIAETYCLRHQRDINLNGCDEMEGLNHKLCFVRIYPSSDDEMTVKHVAVVCDDNDNEFESVTGLNIAELVRLSIQELELKSENRFKLVHQGEPLVIPSLETTKPMKLNFIVATTNCTKDVKLDKNPFQCYLDTTIPAKSCISFIWLETQTKTIHNIDVACQTDNPRVKRSPLYGINNTRNNSAIKDLVTAALAKLEISSVQRYKLRVLHINSYSTKITSGIDTTIDFDVGYTACLKYEWVENVTSCDFLEHLPRRHCVARILERLWLNNGKNIEVSCEDEETPLEAHIQLESAETAMQLAQDSLKHIEAKYPHPRKQKVLRIFSLEKQAVAGIHYRMKIEIGVTTCPALSKQTDCKLDNDVMNKFCRVHVWVRPWIDHPPNFRVFCDFQESSTADLYHHIQAENLFFVFLATYNPSYVNDHAELEKRFEIFKRNIRKIHEFNVHEKGTATFGVTRFTDLTYQEFSSQYMGMKISLRNKNLPLMKTADIPNEELPQSYDWRNFGAVTEVKDQISCGSSWAFSAIGNIEGQWKIHFGDLVSFSEQVLLDCDKLNKGCDGGLPENAFRTIEELGGLQLETDYPYEAEQDKCLFNKTLSLAQLSGVVNITTNETGMAQWLVKNGPISVGINGRPLQFYQGGVMHPWKSYCNGTQLDHSVLIIGFGVRQYPQYHKQLPYWIVKNSWGPMWGEQGYYRVYRGDGTCGINQMASSAVIDN